MYEDEHCQLLFSIISMIGAIFFVGTYVLNAASNNHKMLIGNPETRVLTGQH